MAVADSSRGVDEVQRRPVLVVVGVPGVVVVIEADRERDSSLAYSALDVSHGSLERKLWRVHADHNEFRHVPALHLPQERHCSLTVAARERPELDQYDMAKQSSKRKRLTVSRVQPGMYAK